MKSITKNAQYMALALGLTLTSVTGVLPLSEAAPVSASSDDLQNTVAYHEVTAWMLNVRAEPNAHSHIIGVLHNGEVVGVEGYIEDTKWALIDYDKGENAFVNSSYLKITLSTVKTTANLNLREDAKMSGKILAVIPKGTKLTNVRWGFGDYQKWAYVTYKGYTGWVYDSYLYPNDTIG
ncbi:SH3 domain-containing protein [Fictibacillus fluitans]|uniref:SH3 domain-containing protein n=1 Tax=Fictibacillus fluitans TaxID=3058422 RepID=A0ABT8HZZ3_9BACL|nr:SH3 domain-containing protein [Fictibacillus sp. NE201]MDN4526326.1 SH3 domain-containing protein [Fictibacillus sp. NE201]